MQEQEKWKVLEAQLKRMRSLRRNNYHYLGMNYSSDPANERIRFEYIFRNPQTVWINFILYPETKRPETRVPETRAPETRISATRAHQPDYLRVILVSPFRRDELVLEEWVKQYSHRHNVSSFTQFAGDFPQQAAALVALVDQTLSKSGLDAVLAGRTAVDVPSLSLNT